MKRRPPSRRRPARTTSSTTGPQDAGSAIRRLAPDGVDLIAEVSPAVNNELDVAVARNRRDHRDLRQQRRRHVPRRDPPDLRPEPALPVPAALHPRPGPLAAAAEDVTAAVAAGALRAGEKAGLPLHHYPLEETPAAHDAVERGAVGKVLIDIAWPVTSAGFSPLCTIGLMAYDEVLAGRIRDLIGPDPELTEKKMFGGLAFLIRGHMAISASGQGGVLVHVDPARSSDLVATTAATVAVMQGPGDARLAARQRRRRSQRRGPRPLG